MTEVVVYEPNGPVSFINNKTFKSYSDFFTIGRIANVEINGERDVMNFQEALIQAGLKQYAKF